MKRHGAWPLLFAALLVAGCTVKESEDAEGNKEFDIEPATVEIGTDTQTIKVPDVDIRTDTTPATTTY